MATGMIEIMKVAAMDAIENSKPCDLRFGTVCSVDPLKVQITSDFIIPESLLIVPEYLTDYTVDASLGMISNTSSTPSTPSTGGSLGVTVEGDMLVFTTTGASVNITVIGDMLVFTPTSTNNESNVVATVDEFEPDEDTVDTSSVEVIDERTMTIYNSLQVGDKIALIRNQGGKMYYILDRI